MVEISLSGSGEGLGRAIARGYSTSGKRKAADREKLSEGDLVPGVEKRMRISSCTGAKAMK